MFQQNQILDGRYQILQEIGKGGAGIVYLAYHLSLQKYVVVKQLKGSIDTSSIRTEVDILKRLHHPNLPQVYDFLELDGGVFTVIDYVAGVGMDRLAEQGMTVTQESVLRWFRQLVDVLVYLHSQNPAIIHGDIKPENIIITPENQAVLIDFNVSLSEDPEKILGFSYDYASPEQLAFAQMTVQRIPHEPLDGRSDIYSLAATFYQLLSGCRPSCFYPNKPLLSMELPWPESFCRLIDRCMSKNREERYENAERLARAVQKLRKQEQHYNLYLACQALCILVSGLLFAGGLFCLITSFRVKNREDYVSAYNAVSSLMNQNRYEEAREAGLALLNNGSFQSILEENKEDQAELLYMMGEASYCQENYRQAVSYYLQAAEVPLDSEEQTVIYYQDAALAYAQNGQMEEAKQLLEEAGDAGIRGDGLTLLQIQVDALFGNQAEAAELAEGFLQECGSEEMCRRVCLAVANGTESTEGQIQWLSRGLDFGDDAELLRRLGKAYVSRVETMAGDSDRKYLLEQAESCYRRLTGETESTRMDRVNLAVILRMAGKFEQSLETLKPLETENPEDGLVLLQMAFTYEAAGNAGKAGEYAKTAEEVLSPSEVTESDWNQLNRLLEKYGG